MLQKTHEDVNKENSWFDENLSNEMPVKIHDRLRDQLEQMHTL